MFASASVLVHVGLNRRTVLVVEWRGPPGGGALAEEDQLDEEERAEQHSTVRQRRRQRLPGRAPPFVNTLAMGVRRCYAVLAVWRRLAFTKCGRPHATR